MIHKDKKQLASTKIAHWINQGEKQGFHKRPTCATEVKNGLIWEFGKNQTLFGQMHIMTVLLFMIQCKPGVIKDFSL